MKKYHEKENIRLLLKLSLQAVRRSESLAEGLKRRAVILEEPAQQFILQAVQELEKGRSLGDFFLSLPGEEETYIGKVLISAEQNGKTEQALREILFSMKKAGKFYHTILQSVLYPLTVLLCINLFFIFYNVFISNRIPRIVEEFGMSYSQKRLISEDFIMTVLVILAVFLIFLLFSLKKSRFITHLRPRWFWSYIPVIRKIIYLEYMRLFFSRLKLYLEYSLPLQDALRGVFSTVKYYSFSSRVKEAMLSDAEKGLDLGKILRKAELFEPVYLPFIEEASSGEELIEQLDAIAEHYENNMEIVQTKLSIYLEPLLLVIIGLVVILAFQIAISPVVLGGGLFFGPMY